MGSRKMKSYELEQFMNGFDQGMTIVYEYKIKNMRMPNELSSSLNEWEKAGFVTAARMLYYD